MAEPGVPGGERFPSLGEQALEANGVDLLRSDLEEVAGATREDDVVTYRLAQPRDIDHDHVAGRGRRRVAPKVLNDSVRRDDRAPLQREEREQRTRARTPQLERLAGLTCLEWTQER